MVADIKNNEKSQPIPPRVLKYFNSLTRDVMESLGSDDPQYKEALRLKKALFDVSGKRLTDDTYRLEKEKFLLAQTLSLFERGLAGEEGMALGIPYPCNFHEAVAPNVAWDKGVSPELFKEHLASYVQMMREAGNIERTADSGLQL